MTSSRSEDIAALLRRFNWMRDSGICSSTTRALLDDAQALLSESEYEYGVEYDVSADRSVYTAAHSEKQARKWVAESPTDTGLRRRRAAGPWEVAE